LACCGPGRMPLACTCTSTTEHHWRGAPAMTQTEQERCTHEGLCDERDPGCLYYEDPEEQGNTPAQVREQITEALMQWEDENPGTFPYLSSFADNGVMSMNDGLVLRDGRGGEWQLTLVRSR